MKAVIIFAAGQGTRMLSSLPKVLHTLGGRSMLGHVIETAKSLLPEQIILLISPTLQQYLKDHPKDVDFDLSTLTIAVQETALGTGHALNVALPFVHDAIDDIIILYGDVPFVTKETLDPLISSTASCCFLGMDVDPPHAYGRMDIEGEGDRLLSIIEHKDASKQERAINYVWSGVLKAKANFLRTHVPNIRKSMLTGEYYLTDIVHLAQKDNQKVTHMRAMDASVFQGINDKSDLAKMEARFQSIKRQEYLDAGVKLMAPDTVFFSYDTEIDADATIHPFVTFGKSVKISENATIYSFCHIEQSTLHSFASVGPFAHLRGGNVIHEKASIGNFVEVKNTTLHEHAKAKHLTYLGDAEIGARTNIGAGTITCNYDGVYKHKTTVGNNVFIGANTTLIAPIIVHDDAKIAAGSVITDDVPSKSMAFGRARQVTKNLK